MVEKPAKHVLLAEDDDDLRRMIEVSLRSLATIHGVADGKQALAWLQENPEPDLLITDVMMPGLDGLTLSKMIKRDPKLKRIPILMLTAKGRPNEIVDGINSGARQYMTKPFDRSDLIERVRKLLRL